MFNLKNSDNEQFYLEQRDTSFIAEYYSTPGTSAVDIPKYYANWDEEFWVVAPTPDRTYEITLAYDKEPPYNNYRHKLAHICQINIQIFYYTPAW